LFRTKDNDVDPKVQIRVQRYGWDAASAFYEDGWQGPMRPAHQTLMATAALKPGERVLECACGSGLVTRMIAEAVGPKGEVLATDLSQNMVDMTAHRCAAEGLTWVKTARMNAEDLTVEPEYFDAALCALGIMNVPDPLAAVASMRRAVRPGGRVVATVWGQRKNCGWAELFPIVDARVASEVCPMFFGPGTAGSLARDFETARLEQVHEHRQRETLAFRDEATLLKAMFIGGAVALAVKRFTPEVLAEAQKEFLASVQQYRGGDGRYLIPGEFVTVSAVR
jgi:ubiquinone/menaquinone biosynthesis C-methylase UbiE